MFTDRADAGLQLAQALQHHAGENAVVIALPRGGVPLGWKVARHLGLPLDIRCPHKIGSPYNPEYAIAALTEDGVLLYERAVLDHAGVSLHELECLKERQMRSIGARIATLRRHIPRQRLQGRTAIIVDDGLATGATMFAAIHMARAEGASRVVVAVPVAPSNTLDEVSAQADEVVCLVRPIRFSAVGEFYRDFEQVTDEEVIAMLDAARPQEIRPPPR